MAVRRNASTQITCTLCGHPSVLFDRNSSVPVCLNRTRCARRQRSTEVHIREFIRRFRAMPLDKQAMWIAALKEEIWKVPRRRRKKVEIER